MIHIHRQIKERVYVGLCSLAENHFLESKGEKELESKKKERYRQTDRERRE